MGDNSRGGFFFSSLSFSSSSLLWERREFSQDCVAFANGSINKGHVRNCLMLFLFGVVRLMLLCFQLSYFFVSVCSRLVLVFG